MLRVITGTARGRRLKSMKGLDVRPTSDRVKQSLFNVLGPRVPGCTFLDVFAGTGAVAIEALSRGAARAVLVEASPAAARIITENLALTGLAAAAEVIRHDAGAAMGYLGRRGDQFDLIFLDPPYRQGLVAPGIEDAARHGLLAPGGLLAAQHDRREAVPDRASGLVRFRIMTFGDTVVSLYQADSGGAGGEESRREEEGGLCGQF